VSPTFVPTSVIPALNPSSASFRAFMAGRRSDGSGLFERRVDAVEVELEQPLERLSSHIYLLPARTLEVPDSWGQEGSGRRRSLGTDPDAVPKVELILLRARVGSAAGRVEGATEHPATYR
jgi:hypothetical protein